MSMNPMASICAMVLGLGLAVAAGAAENVSEARTAFANPGKEYSTIPFWVWNDLMTDEEISGTLQAFAAQGVRQVFVHPRPGLMTPYLSEEWFRLWKVTMAEAERLDMNVWIYDENSYPSGFAGGWVPEVMPESRGLGLVMRDSDKPGVMNENVVAVYREHDGGYEDVTEGVRAKKNLPDGKYLIALLQRSNSSPWFGGKWYVDLLRPGVTEKFLELTLDPYLRELPNDIGKRIPGSFTDEPHLSPAGGFHWTPDLPKVFEKRWGYSILDVLPSLTKPVGEWKQVRHNYYQVLLELFIDRWAKPYFEYCTKNHLEFTGHYWEHSWPDCGSAPDNMAMGAWQHRPGIDILFNQYDEGPHAQFGNVRAVLELASVANQMGWRRTLCETYGGSGWDARFEDLKRIGDWVEVLGVNTINEHLSHVTLRGARKGDYPPSFSYHTPWWEAYHVMEGYFTRVSYALSQGQQINRILVIEPTTTVWMYQGQGGRETAEQIGNTFQKLVTDLAKAQIEYDIGCEDIMARNGAVEGKTLLVGRRNYDLVVIPPLTENLNARTAELLEGYLAGGGQVISCDATPPACVDAKPSERGAALARQSGWTHQAPEGLADALRAKGTDGFAVLRAADDAGILYHHRRQLGDADLVFLVNTSNTSPTSGIIQSAMHRVEEWDLHTGAVRPYAFAKSSDGVTTEFALPPCGSLLLCLPKEAGKPAASKPETRTAIAAAGPMRIKVADPNVLTVDFVDFTAGGDTQAAIYCDRAAALAFKKNGMERNPWDHAVQFQDEFLSKTFSSDSGFTVSYRFTIEGAAPETLYFVAERPDLYTITCNGKAVAAAPGEWWLDRAFGKIDIRGAAIVGENIVTLVASPFSVFHEVAAAYVVGDFSVKPVEKGFVITPKQEIGLGPWKTQGLPLYGGGVSYAATFKVASASGKHVVRLGEWYGSVAKVTVNGKVAGYVYAPPAECDVTGLMVSGDNIIEVTVFGTLKNTLGPHHGDPPLGFASPGSFEKAPETGPPAGAAYSTIDYGLFAPFVLERLE